MAWLAIDCGTSVVKAVAFGSDGAELALARENTTVLHTSPRASEQSMDAVWSAISKTTRAVVSQLAEPVRGIATTAQGDGCWLVDAQGRPVGNAILWNDGRANAAIERWFADRTIARAFEISGSVCYPGLSNAIFAWLYENEPERLASAKYSLTCNGWIFSQMTGSFAADLSDASNPFGDVRSAEYSLSLLELYAAQSHARLLPPIARSASDLVRPLLPEAAEQLGLQAGTPVVMAPYDIVTTAYGAGVVKPGQACVILGTTICAETLLDFLPEQRLAGTTLALGDGMYLRAMPTLCGTETLSWAAAVLGVNGIAGLERLAMEATSDATELLFLPYLSPAGERAPFLDPRARGSFHGLSLAHTRHDLARAVYEGLSFAVRECLETATAELREVRVCGGGARSSLWCQLIADVTGLSVVRPAESELGARGAFLRGLHLSGERESVQAASDRLPLKLEIFESRNDRHHLLNRRYARFLETRELARSQWALDGQER